MEFPEPVINVAIEPKTGWPRKMGIALAKLAEKTQLSELIQTKKLVRQL